MAGSHRSSARQQPTRERSIVIKKLAKSIASHAAKRSRKKDAAVQTHAPVVEQILSEPQHPLPTSPVPGLIKQLRDPTAEVARDAALALGSLHDTSAVEALCAVLINQDLYFHCVVRSAAADSLGKLRDRRALNTLLTGVRDPIAETSQQAIRALGDESAVPALIAVAQNADGYFLPAARQTALEVLAQFSAPAAAQFLRTHKP